MFEKIRIYLKTHEEQVSIWSGAVIVVLVAILFFSYFRSVNKAGQIPETAGTTEVEQVETLTDFTERNLPVEYVIKKGDNLWKIADTVYNDGFQWEKIYEANKALIADPDVIDAGLKITIPKIENLPELKTYTVEKGDSLWKVATAQCGTGYQWTTIAAQNHLVNPSLIHPGETLKFRCAIR